MPYHALTRVGSVKNKILSITRAVHSGAVHLALAVILSAK